MPISKRGSFQDHDFGSNEGSFKSDSSQSESSGGSQLTDNDSASSLSGSARKSTRVGDLFGLSNTEEHAITWCRGCFLFILLAVAGGLATIIYMITAEDQQQSFETEFYNMAEEIMEQSENKVMQSLAVLNGVSTTITSYMNHQNSMVEMNHGYVYPPGFVTLTDAEHHFQVARNVTGALVIGYLPRIEPQHLGLWKNFSFAYQGWIAESNQVQEFEPILTDIWEYAPENERRRSLSTCDAIVGGPARRRLQTELKEEEMMRNEMEEHAMDTPQDPDDTRVPLEAKEGPFSPVWTLSPPPPPDDTFIVNYNLMDKPVYKKAVDFIEFTRKPTFLDVCNQAAWFGNQDHKDILQTVVAYPVFSDFMEEAPIVGHVATIIPWKVFFQDILSAGSEPVHVVLTNTCEETFTFEVHGHKATLLSDKSDVHKTLYDDMVQTGNFAEYANPPELKEAGLGQHCVYTISVYPTPALEEFHKTQEPMWYALIVLGAFVLTAVTFMVFDYLVQRKQAKVVSTALKQNAIVSSLFPKNIQAKMMAEIGQAEKKKLTTVGKAGLKRYLDNGQEARKGGNDNKVDKTKPIADLFPETTIMFADIAGFTAWSSTREPSAVFTLLETIYHEFDAIAKRRRVFKVEVVGDCYVAVCGLPDPRRDHAIVMAKFAHECLRKMERLTTELEVELGPDTADLGLRVGLHSGPVVAGVLRGEKSRFQLFGDTMNTASRMESNGVPNRIQISQDTADLLIAAGKHHWCIAREDKIKAKGKGMLSTYWLMTGGGGGGAKSNLTSDMSVGSHDLSLDGFDLRDHVEAMEKKNRIADWTVEIMACLLKEIAARRKAASTKRGSKGDMFVALGSKKKSQKNLFATHTKDATVIDEVQEIIMLPEYDADVARKEASLDPNEITLSQDVFDELRDYIRTIASLYNENPFHNFAHANHVTMSVTKLLGRIVAPDVEDFDNETLHDHTYGITSDPLTRFAVVFSAMIHDVDHTGASNMQLVKEKAPVAKIYKGKSVAEQNSIDLAWDLLMEPTYENLRRAIYTTEAEFKRFRELVVNTVMATDIMDKDLKKLRNDRWDAAFATDSIEDPACRQAVNRKATIVIEHLIQASDVAHTMQHWHIYRKWNERLFAEMYKAYTEGRMQSDPSENWYKGEIGFFDFYIIPLAKKLKECGVFGVSSEEYLNYAQQNRKEWEERGEECVAEMIENVKRQMVGDKVFSVAQELNDEEGQKIVEEMSKKIRRTSLGQKVPLEISTHDKTPSDTTNTEPQEDEDMSDASGDYEMDLNDD